MHDPHEIPLIVGRPFMSTASCVVDMGKGKLELSVDNQNVTFDLFDTMKHLSDHKAYFKMDKVEQEIDMVAKAMVMQTPLEKVLTNTLECLTAEEEKEVQSCLKELEGEQESFPERMKVEELKRDRPPEEAKMELKTLPKHLKYVFLGENNTKPVIISNSLKREEEAQLVEILKKHTAAIGWHISDLKGISPSYCMHKINMEADYKPVR